MISANMANLLRFNLKKPERNLKKFTVKIP